MPASSTILSQNSGSTFMQTVHSSICLAALLQIRQK